jgi:hypothetical protein
MARVGKTTLTSDVTTVFIDKFLKNSGAGVCTSLPQQAGAVQKYQGTVGKRQWINGTLEYERTNSRTNETIWLKTI